MSIRSGRVIVRDGRLLACRPVGLFSFEPVNVGGDDAECSNEGRVRPCELRGFDHLLASLVSPFDHIQGIVTNRVTRLAG